jgi:hypothetical protein
MVRVAATSWRIVKYGVNIGVNREKSDGLDTYKVKVDDFASVADGEACSVHCLGCKR